MRLSAVYTPLDRSSRTTRLLQFTDTSTTQDIRCVLETYDVADALSLDFVALSYVWGQDRPRRKINLNGVIIIIRENLYQALRILQASNFDHTYFWIDAICINQDDPLERGHQVGLMKEIFSGAACVVSWLGADFQNSSWAMERVHSDAMDYDTRNILTPFEVLDHLDYWRRMWIIQE
ncbi:HET-domain-containing protein, partial [Cryphonectria parasitica EP155]